MAVGDVVSSIGGANATLDFQPAAGVEVAIKTTFSQTGTARSAVMYDGVINTMELKTDMSAATNAYLTIGSVMFVTNTNYLRIFGSGGALRNGFTGIEIA